MSALAERTMLTRSGITRLVDGLVDQGLIERVSCQSDARVSYAHTVTVKTGACGIAVAPPFTASRQPGGYIVKASAKPARSAAFALVNEAPGQSR